MRVLFLEDTLMTYTTITIKHDSDVVLYECFISTVLEKRYRKHELCIKDLQSVVDKAHVMNQLFKARSDPG